jgi:protein SCO1/2
MKFSSNALCAVLLLLYAACGPSPQAAKRYPLTGKIVSVDHAGLSVVIDGDDVPGFMPAMSMSYKVKNASDLNSLTPGDSVSAVIVMQGDNSWLENVTVTQRSTAPPSAHGSSPANQ